MQSQSEFMTILKIYININKTMFGLNSVLKFKNRVILLEIRSFLSKIHWLIPMLFLLIILLHS